MYKCGQDLPGLENISEEVTVKVRSHNFTVLKINHLKIMNTTVTKNTTVSNY